jgi:SpoIID/LytB domain protein
VLSATPLAANADAPAPPAKLIPAIQIDGRGHGHGVGMAQDGALAMGMAGANVKQILAQFYPGTTIGKASGSVRVPVFTGDKVELTFPDGGEVHGYPAPSSPGGANSSIRLAPGATVLVYRDGDGTRVKQNTTAPPASPASTTTSTTALPTTTTSPRPAATTTTLLPVPHNGVAGSGPAGSPRTPPTTPGAPKPSPSTTTTTQPSAAALYAGTVTATPTGNGRVGVTPRGRRYRGVIEMTPTGGGVRFVNQVPVETYLRGMGEVRNPSWPAAGLQAQAIAARTYALRAQAFGGELCDSQRCQVYIGSDAEYAAMDKAVAETAGQVLMYGKSLASAVYSANAGGHTADRFEGFGLAGDSYPYLRAAPYVTSNLDEWSVTIALADVARRLGYSAEVTEVNVVGRGPSGRATSVDLVGGSGTKTVTGLQFDAALGLRSTLFTLKPVMAASVADVKGESLLQAPPEEAAAVASTVSEPTAPPPRALDAAASRAGHDDVGFASLIAAALWGGVVVSAILWRRRNRVAIHNLLS